MPGDYNRYGYKRDSYGNRTRIDGKPKFVQRFTATVGDKTFVRNSPNVYTHAVVGRKGEAPMEVLKWCNSDDQAHKDAKIRFGAGYSDVQVIEVTVSPYIKEYHPDKK